MSSNLQNLNIDPEQKSILARAYSIVLNTFTKKQTDYLKKRKFKQDIIITALFFWIGLDTSKFDGCKNFRRRLQYEVTEAANLNNNMDSNDFNQVSELNSFSSFVVCCRTNSDTLFLPSEIPLQAGSNDPETQKLLLRIKLEEQKAKTAEAEAQKEYAKSARSRALAASRAAINISRDNQISVNNINRMVRESNILCSPAGVNYRGRLPDSPPSVVETESIDRKPQDDASSEAPVAAIEIPQGNSRNSPSLARGGVSDEELASAFAKPDATLTLKRSRDDDDDGDRPTDEQDGADRKRRKLNK